MTHTFIVTVESDDTDATVRVDDIRDEITSNLESVYDARISVREYLGRPWLLLGGVQE